MSDTTTSNIRTIDGVELPAAGTWAIDVSHSSVNFKVKHLGVASTRGRFDKFEGTVEIGENPADTKVNVSVDTASVDTHDGTRDEHLRSADFFDVANHPAMTFRSTGVSGTGDSWTLDGDLTIAGVTQPVSLDVEFEGVATSPWGSTSAGFAASTTVNREEFGLTWNTALAAGGFLVGKNVLIELEVELVKQ
ncbi:MAG: YceI family protein [Acidimicrobiales bacterium]|jgi:polyisoprenoid-binding protein YceI|nr:YceI family protein [Acidimicrobiales bacterium]